MRLLQIISILGFVVFIYCGGSQQTINTTDDIQIPDSKKNAEWNEDFDPMTLGDYALDIEGRKASDDAADIDQLLRGGAAADTAVQRSQIRGFRVQLISTRNEEEARAVMRNAAISFSEPTYREYDNPYYKIRVGDFKSRYEASLVQEQAIELGFHEAWVVRAMIWDGPPPQKSANPEKF